MLDLQNNTAQQTRLNNPLSSPLSDDECLVRLATVVRDHDVSKLDEVAWLIGRLAVPIE